MARRFMGSANMTCRAPGMGIGGVPFQALQGEASDMSSSQQLRLAAL